MTKRIYTRTPAPERFWAKVDRRTDSECWPWRAGGLVGSNGYGRFHDGVRQCLAHRFAYELLVGPIPQGLVIDHLCRNRACVNPAHMEPVTTRENLVRGVGPSAQNVAKTHCPQGHPYDEANTLWVGAGRTDRHCKICQRSHLRALRARRRAAMCP